MNGDTAINSRYYKMLMCRRCPTQWCICTQHPQYWWQMKDITKEVMHFQKKHINADDTCVIHGTTVTTRQISSNISSITSISPESQHSIQMDIENEDDGITESAVMTYHDDTPSCIRNSLIDNKNRLKRLGQKISLSKTSTTLIYNNEVMCGSSVSYFENEQR